MRTPVEAEVCKTPPKDLQREFWDGWNATFRLKTPDEFMERQRAVAMAWAAKLGAGTILEVGCGTGWLCDALSRYGKVTGIDLSPASIREARARFSGITFLEGDFQHMDLPPHDLVVSADVIAHVENQLRFVEKVATWTRPGGTFVLMTQNPFVWSRSSYLMPQGRGQIRNWPPLDRLRRMLGPWFSIQLVSSIVPGGDLGILRYVNHRIVAGGLRRLLGRRLTTSLYERALLGRELVVVSKRRVVPTGGKNAD